MHLGVIRIALDHGLVDSDAVLQEVLPAQPGGQLEIGLGIVRRGAGPFAEPDLRGIRIAEGAYDALHQFRHRCVMGCGAGGTVETGEGLDRTAESFVGEAEIDPSRRHVRIEGDGSLEMGDRFVEAIELDQGGAQVRVELGVLRFELEGLPVACDGLGIPAEQAKRDEPKPSDPDKTT